MAETNPDIFHSTPENFPTLIKQQKNSGTAIIEEAKNIASTVRTTPTRMAQTTVSSDIETIVTKIDTVISQYNQVFE